MTFPRSGLHSTLLNVPLSMYARVNRRRDPSLATTLLVEHLIVGCFDQDTAMTIGSTKATFALLLQIEQDLAEQESKEASTCEQIGSFHEPASIGFRLPLSDAIR